MAQQDRSTLESYFETGDVPTQAQFAELIESVPNIIDDGMLLGAEDGITAFAGGGQGSATPMTKLLNRVTTVASTGDSVLMPGALAGMLCSVRNDGANAMDIFPSSGEQIDSLGIDAAYSLAAGQEKTFGALDSGQWYS